MSDIKDDEKEILLDHDYDSIQELDNPLPMWWLLTFYATIIFSAAYFFYYIVGGGPSLSDEFKQDVAEIQEVLDKSNADAASNVDWAALAVNDAAVDQGKQVFEKNCASCHGMHGEGGIGPNLTDEYWLHGNGTLETIAETIKVGVLEKGMPPWNDVLKPQDLQAATVYIASIKGSNPENAKAPQGDKVE